MIPRASVMLCVSCALSCWPKALYSGENREYTTTVEIALTQFTASDDQLSISYKISNRTSKDICFCRRMWPGDDEVFVGYSQGEVSEALKLFKPPADANDKASLYDLSSRYNAKTVYIRRTLEQQTSFSQTPRYTFEWLPAGTTTMVTQSFELPMIANYVNMPHYFYDRDLTLRNMQLEIEYFLMPRDVAKLIQTKESERRGTGEQSISESNKATLWAAKSSLGTIGYVGNNRFNFPYPNPNIEWKQQRHVLRIHLQGVSIPFTDQLTLR